MNKVICEHFNKCGGCTLLQESYAKQLLKKQTLVKSELKEHNLKAKVNSTVGMFYPYKYRNKVHLAVRGTVKEPEIGFFMEGSNKVVPINNCLLHDVWVVKIIDITKDYIKKFNITPYDKKRNKGVLKYVVARFVERELQITLVVTTNKIQGRQWFYNEISKCFKSVSFYINVNTRTDNAVFDDKNFKHECGFKKLRGNMLGVKYELSPQSFFQINCDITEKIYKHINEIIKPHRYSIVLDLYSGIGITSCIFAKMGARVVSIESVPDAVKDAKSLIKLNKLEGLVTAYLGRCEQLMNKINFNKIVGGSAEVNVFLDPPRVGCIKSVLDKVVELCPQKIVYLSCNPVSLARDLSILTLGGYEISEVTPYDMFPQTHHIETLAVLIKK